MDYIINRSNDVDEVEEYEDFKNDAIKVKNFEKLFKEIITKKGMQTVKFKDGVIDFIDMQTANVALKVMAELSKEHKDKAERLMQTHEGFLRFIDFVWKCVK
jgi:hypothetical protein